MKANLVLGRQLKSTLFKNSLSHEGKINQCFRCLQFLECPPRQQPAVHDGASSHVAACCYSLRLFANAYSLLGVHSFSGLLDFGTSEGAPRALTLWFYLLWYCLLWHCLCNTSLVPNAPVGLRNAYSYERDVVTPVAGKINPCFRCLRFLECPPCQQPAVHDGASSHVAGCVVSGCSRMLIVCSEFIVCSPSSSLHGVVFLGLLNFGRSKSRSWPVMAPFWLKH